MEQHPIPTNVSSYQFKLVGDMTLKQFFQLAGGILIGILFYSSPLLPIIRYPLAFISGLLGVGLAFLPFEERPLERWIIAFFRAIYSPTMFTWTKGSGPKQIFIPETLPEGTQQDPALKDYLNKSAQPAPAPTTNLDKAESGFLAKLTGIVNNLSVPQTPLAPNVSTTSSQPLPSIIPDIPDQSKTLLNTQSVAVEQKSTQLNTLQTPVNTPVKIEHVASKLIVEEAASPNLQPGVATSTQVSPVIAGNEMISTHQALFSVDAAPPNPPTIPNVVVGQIVDQERRIVEGAIMEIRDSGGRPIRALRSNKAGHFITVTQLDNGHYEIITEKEGYEFNPLSFDATGALIPPILIQGKRLSPLLPMPDIPVKPAYSIN